MNDHPATQYTPLSAMLPRLYWMVFGNIILLLVFVTTLLGSFHNLIVASALFWLNTIGMALVRYLEIRYLQGETADCRKATMVDWRRYVLSLLVASVCLWGIALTFRALPN